MIKMFRCEEVMAEQWLSIVEYARTFAVSDMTVRRRIKTGRLQAVLRDGKYYIPLSASCSETEDLPANEMAEPMLAKSQLASSQGIGFVSGVSANLVLQNQTISSRPPEDRLDGASLRLGASFKTLPVQLVQSLQKSDQSLVETQGLLQYCDQSLTRINSIERHLQEGYQLRLQNIEGQLKIKDGLIAELMQQVEDLQMLVRLMEQNPKALARNQSK